PFMQGLKLVRTTHNRILIAASDVVVIDVPWPGIQPINLDDIARGVVRRELEGRSAQSCGLDSETNLARRRFLLQLGGDVHGRARNVKPVDRVATTLAQAHQAGMNTDAKVDRISARSGRNVVALNVPGSDAGTIGVILIGAGPTKDGDA